MYLLDTNIWLERLLERSNSEDVGQVLSLLPTEGMLMSDFTPHSLGVIFNRLGHCGASLQFVDEVLIHGGVMVVSVPPGRFERIVAAMEQFNLDFDAYQYALAELLNATIVSFDGDFERTDHGRATLAEALVMLEQPEG
jgi:hypothetical protein